MLFLEAVHETTVWVVWLHPWPLIKYNPDLCFSNLNNLFFPFSFALWPSFSPFYLVLKSWPLFCPEPLSYSFCQLPISLPASTQVSPPYTHPIQPLYTEKQTLNIWFNRQMNLWIQLSVLWKMQKYHKLHAFNMHICCQVYFCIFLFSARYSSNLILWDRKNYAHFSFISCIYA